MKPLSALITVSLLTGLALAQSPGEVEITAEPHHHQVLQNDYVRVFNLEAAPREATLMHRHRHDYVFIVMGDSEVENDVAGKPPVTLKMKNGETRFLAGGFAHLAKNLAPTPFRNVTIEFLKDEAAHKTAPPKWDQERGLNILNGGTQDILFVQDGVRVSELDLQPGGVVPKHHHIGPHLAVAVTELDFRSDVEGKGSSTVHMNAGQALWIPGGSTHTLTNVGKAEAKWITLEFQ